MTNDGYKPEYAEKAFALAFAEWTNARIADYFGIDLTRFRQWERNHQAFDDALDRARSMLDDYDKEVAEGFDYRHPKRGGGGDSLNTGVGGLWLFTFDDVVGTEYILTFDDPDTTEYIAIGGA